MGFKNMIARPMLAIGFVKEGIDATRHAKDNAEQFQPWVDKIDPEGKYLTAEKTAKALGIAQVGAGALLTAGKLPKVASMVLAATSIPGAIAEYNNTPVKNAAQKENRTEKAFKNLSMVGGLLLTAGKAARK